MAFGINNGSESTSASSGSVKYDPIAKTLVQTDTPSLEVKITETKKAVEELSKKIDSLQSLHQQDNTSSAAAIEENKKAIMANAKAIDDNAKNISTNTADIQANKSAIQSAQATLTNHTELIGTLQTHYAKIEEAKAYMDECAAYNKAICGFDGNNGIGIFDPAKTYNYGDLMAIKNDNQYTIYRCIVSSHTGAFSEADFVGTNMFQEYNRIYASGANEMVTVVVTKDGTPISGKEVILNNITTSKTQTATTNKDGVAIFSNIKDEDKVPYGQLYTVTAGAEEGCDVIPESTFVANTPARTIKLAFTSTNPDYDYDTPCLTVYAYERQQIALNNTALEEALAGKTCTLLINGEVKETVAFNGRVAQFVTQIPTYTSYTLVVPNLRDANLQIATTNIDVISMGFGSRPVSANYYLLHPNAGVVGITASGETYNSLELEAALEALETEDEKKALRDSILYIGISNEATQPADEVGITNHTGGLVASITPGDGTNTNVYSTITKNCSFMFHLRQKSGETYKALKWQDGALVNLLGIPFTPHNNAGWLKDMDGQGRTAQIVQDNIVFPAKDFVTDESGNIQSPFSGETLKPFMPASGQLYQMQLYKNDICRIYRLAMGLAADGNDVHACFSGLWWSSSQPSATNAINLNNGSMYSNSKSLTSINAFRAYEFD